MKNPFLNNVLSRSYNLTPGLDLTNFITAVKLYISYSQAKAYNDNRNTQFTEVQTVVGASK